MPISKFIIFSLLILLTGYKSYAQACPPNIDFEAGNYSRWEFFIGYCCPLNANVSTLPSPGVGSGCSATSSTSGPPKRLYWITVCMLSTIGKGAQPRGCRDANRHSNGPMR